MKSYITLYAIKLILSWEDSSLLNMHYSHKPSSFGLMYPVTLPMQARCKLEHIRGVARQPQFVFHFLPKSGITQ